MGRDALSDTFVVRYRSTDGQFRAGRALHLVEWTDERIVGFLPEGAIVAEPVLADGRGLRDVPLAERWAHPRATELRPWVGNDLLMIFPRGRLYSLWIFRRHGEVLGWYVNLEERHTIEGRTITTRDGVLDIWVPADTGEPQWKDEDEFEVAIAGGRLAPDEAKVLRAEGERVLAERPWPTGFETWEPPPGFVAAELPAGWDS